MNRPTTAFTLLLVSILLAGCGESAGPSTDATVADRSTREVVRIGSLDDPVYSLTRVGQLVALPDGGVLSTHGSEGLIRRFDTDGQLVYAVGGMGEGPGEFQGLGATTVLGDAIAAADFRTGLVSLFDLASGDHIESFRVDLSGTDFDGRSLSVSAALAPDTFVAWPSTPSRLVASGEITTIDFLLIDRDGRPLDTLPSIQRGNGQWAISFPGGGGAYTAQPFGDETLWQIHRGGEMTLIDREVVDSEAPVVVVSRLTADGDTLWSTNLRYDPQPIFDAEVDSIIDAATPENPPGNRTRSDYAEGWRASLYRPAHRPGAERVVVGEGGRVWVGGAPRAETTRWWVLSPEGELLHTVEVPSSLTVMAAAGDRVWAVEYDELRVPYVVGLEVEAP